MKNLKSNWIFFLLLSFILGCDKNLVEPKKGIEFYFKGDTNNGPFNFTTKMPVIDNPVVMDPNNNPLTIIYSTQIGEFLNNNEPGIEVRLDCKDILTAGEIRALEGKTITSFFGFSNQYPQLFIRRSNGFDWDAIYESPDQSGSEVKVTRVYRTEDYDDTQLKNKWVGLKGKVASYVLDEIFVAECTGKFKIKDQQYSNVEFNMLLYSMKLK